MWVQKWWLNYWWFTNCHHWIFIYIIYVIIYVTMILLEKLLSDIWTGNKAFLSVKKYSFLGFQYPLKIGRTQDSFLLSTDVTRFCLVCISKQVYRMKKCIFYHSKIFFFDCPSTFCDALWLFITLSDKKHFFFTI